MVDMSKGSFRVDSERLENSFFYRILDNDDNIVFEVNNWGAFSDSNNRQVNGLCDCLNKLSDENQKLKSVLNSILLSIDCVDNSCTITTDVRDYDFFRDVMVREFPFLDSLKYDDVKGVRLSDYKRFCVVPNVGVCDGLTGKYLTSFRDCCRELNFVSFKSDVMVEKYYDLLYNKQEEK